MSWWTDHPLPCPSFLNLPGDLRPPATPPAPHPSSTWIMHQQTDGSELMSQLLSSLERDRRPCPVTVIPSRPLAQVSLSTRCLRFGVMNYGSSPSPLLYSVTILGGESVRLGTCRLSVCVGVYAWLCLRMESRWYAHSVGRLESFNFAVFASSLLNYVMWAFPI